MKISKKFILLLLTVTTTTFSYNLDNVINVSEKFTKFQVNSEGEEPVLDKQTSIQCEESIKNYSNCFYGRNKITKENLNDVCNHFQSDKCQTFYSSTISKKLPECYLLYQESIEPLVRISQASLAFFCQKDEKHQICPLTELELTYTTSTLAEEILKKAVIQTCSSSLCHQAALSLYTLLNDLIDDEEAILSEDSEMMKNNKMIREIYHQLSSEACTNPEKASKTQGKLNKLFYNLKQYL